MAQTQRRIVRIDVDASSFRREVRQINRELNRTRRAAESMADALRTAFTGFIGSMAFDNLRRFVESMAEIERVDNLLRGTVDSTDEFSESLDFLRSVAERYGIQLSVLQEGYAQFAIAAKSAGLTVNETKESFEGLTVAAAAFQVRGAELELLFLGFRQLMGSAVVNMEDLNQVISRIPNGLKAAIDATREYTGNLELSGGEMRALIGTGEILTDRWLPEFSRRLRELNLPGAERQMNSYAAAVGRLNTAWEEMLRVLVDAGLLDAVGELVQTLTAAVRGMTELGRGGGAIQVAAAVAGVSEEAIAVRNAEARLAAVQNDRLNAFLAPNAHKKLVQQREEELRVIRQQAEDMILLEHAAGEMDRQLQRSDEIRAQNQRMLAKQMEGLEDVPFTGPAEEPRARGGGGGRRAGGKSEAEKQAEELLRLSEAVLSLRGQLDPLVRVQNEHAENVLLLAQAYEAGAISMEDYTMLAQKSIEISDQQREVILKQAEDMEDAGAQMSDAFVHAFGDMITGARGFMDVLSSLERSLISVITQALVLEPLKKGLSTLGVPGLIGGLLGIPAKAEGGPVQAGRPVLVGERGPELLVPSTAGNVIPNDKIGGTTIVVNFNAPVTGEGVRQSSAQLAGDLAAMTSRAAARNG